MGGKGSSAESEFKRRDWREEERNGIWFREIEECRDMRIGGCGLME